MNQAALEITAHEYSGTVFRYRLKSTGHSSDRYGKCEVCDQHASEVFVLSSYMLYERKRSGDFGWTHGFMLFGHAECLKSRRVGPPVMTLNLEYAKYKDANFRALVNGTEVLIGRDREGFKVYIGDAYEALRSTLSAAYRFAEEAANHPERRRPVTVF